MRRADLQLDRPTTPTGRRPAAGSDCSPGQAALERRRSGHAPNLYFVSRNDGSHVFAATLEEHNRNVLEYQVRYFRDRRR